MKILETRVMRGPNIWSNARHDLIVMKIDLEEIENFPTNKIPGFADRLEALIPSLFKHRCSEKEAGGFFVRVREGTWMGHVIEHIALELQTLAGMEVGFGRTRGDGKEGVYNVIFSYEIERAGLYAANAAFNVADALIKGESYDLSEDIRKLSRIKIKEGLGTSTSSIVEEAVKRGIPYRRLDEHGFVVFGYGINQRKIMATMSDATSSIGVDLAGDKDDTKAILSKAFIPVPKGVMIYEEEELEDALDKIGFPVVIKPLDGNHGRGVTINITSKEHAVTAYKIARDVSENVIIEKYITGNDYRFLVVNHKLVAVAKRTPAMVVGDGSSTIKQLIEEVNKDPRRGDGHDNVLTKIEIDHETEEILKNQKLSLETILPQDEVLHLKNTANISTGGTSHDLTDKVHPFNRFMAERISRLINLDICGIDIMAKDIDIPITHENGAVIEVNAAPGFRMHLDPSKGIARNVAEPVVDMLFPQGRESRIPIIAVTGTNGKTTTVRLIAHFAKMAGHVVGYTTTEGIYLGEQLVHEGDCSGPRSATAVLLDPTIDFAVLECARGGILRSGLGFDNCNIGIVTNVTSDHLGLGGIDTIEQMADVKSVVPKSAFDHGYAILNADDDLVYDMQRDLYCNIALFSLNAENERIKQHCAKDGYAAFIEKDYLVISKGKWKTRVDKIANIPITFKGKAEAMIKNLLPATLAAFIQNFDIETIREALHTFTPSPQNTPGRLNVFDFGDFKVMIDYAHNEDGFKELKKFLKHVKASRKVGIIAVAGDRRDQDIIAVGARAAEIFDEIIIRMDLDLRGSTKERLTELLREGISAVNPRLPVLSIDTEKDALFYAMNHAREGAFITVCTEKVYKSIEVVTKAQQEHNGHRPQPARR